MASYSHVTRGRSAPFKIVGIGELVWDVFPEGKQPGGAPANFAFHVRCLGDEGIVVSGVGDDDLGREALDHLRANGLSTRYVQRPPGRPTGTVQVTVDAAGQPTFDIRSEVAWDFLEYTVELQELGAQADAVCFGSLAQRAEQSRATTQRFLDRLPDAVLKIFDVNLRQDFFEAETLRASLQRADVAKLNHEEAPRVCRLLGLGNLGGFRQAARRLQEAFSLELVVVTRGQEGSLLLDDTGNSHSHPGHPAQVADTVGAGDAFTAAIAYFYLRGAPLEILSEAGNRLGSWVTSKPGATPPGSAEVACRLKESLSR